MNFFKPKQRSPADLVRTVREGVSKLDSGPVEARKRVRPTLVHPLLPIIAYKAAARLTTLLLSASTPSLIPTPGQTSIPIELDVHMFCSPP